MKRSFVLIGFLFSFFYSYAQVANEAPDADLYADTIVVSPAQAHYNAAETAFAQYNMLKNDPTSDKDVLFETLLGCFMDYVKCMDELEDEQKENVKTNIMQLRPEMEDAGVYYSQHDNNPKAAKFLECYLNIPRLPLFEEEQFANNENYPAYIFLVAAESYNARDFETAASFLQEYIDLGEKRNQQTCYLFLARALQQLERFDDEASVLEEGIMNYSNDLELIKEAVRVYQKRNNKEKINEMLTKGLTLAPNDALLLLAKASYEEQEGNYPKAITIYNAFYKRDSTNIPIVKDLAFCHYNYAGELLNKSNTATDATQFQALRKEATDNYNKTIKLLEPLSKSQEVIQNDSRVIYALSDALTQVGRADEAGAVRQQQNGGTVNLAAKNVTKEATPNFNEWYKPRLDRVLADWEKRGEFEPAQEYAKRVNADTRKDLAIKTRNQLEEEFIQEYSSNYNLEDNTLKNYDPDHQTYRIQTKQGDLYIKVPIADDEAKKFKEAWNGVKIQFPKFKVDKDGKLLLATAQFVTPYGASYTYDVNEPLEYGKIKIAKPVWNDEDLFANNTVDTPRRQAARTTVDEPLVVGESTIDVNIPKTKDVNENTFVLIINNEKYKNVDPVPFAERDGNSFKRYCVDVLGVPNENIIHAANATGNEMTVAIDQIKQFENAYRGMRLLVYYSGHGVPDPSTNETYLLPCDGSPHNMSTCYKLTKFYTELTANNPGSVTVFLDACFSGAKRDGKTMDTAARGVIVKAKAAEPISNMVVFSASTGSETAYPYNNQRHGLFTYFLLKKLQEEKGKVTYKKLFDYVETQVKQQSIRLNGKIQTPTVQTPLPPSEWGNWRLDK